ncbi:SMP-30/gluconolactonase/LRE family protein [Acidisoma cellulosilytica]|uniref:SMP-30/gluconolactonase/LRE family protein n=1 Tax=Acidisoma cellulosilyticum TaxID=2802395 RepID=A0A963Z7D5_9PROT|nr:SMP-30/gluconolactonase/LRE family protein [Acidisoma cellulosilyticum]MCB8883869.1 SMP-30/gluconolactonase/LRE family protein [Acidisoma cellulosilyticum]
MSGDADIRVLVDCKNILGEGPLWDVEEQRLYWIDSFGDKVFRCTEQGTEVQEAAVYSGQIVRFAPDGTIDRIIKTPVLKATSVMFGGPDMDVMYVTSMARPPLPRFPEDGPMAGHLFAIHGLGVKGISESRFLG